MIEISKRARVEVEKREFRSVISILEQKFRRLEEYITRPKVDMSDPLRSQKFSTVELCLVDQYREMWVRINRDKGEMMAIKEVAEKRIYELMDEYDKDKMTF